MWQTAQGSPPKVTTLAFKWAINHRLESESVPSLLGNEMIDMCEGMPIYWLRRLEDNALVTDQNGIVACFSKFTCHFICFGKAWVV